MGMKHLSLVKLLLIYLNDYIAKTISGNGLACLQELMLTSIFDVVNIMMCVRNISQIY